MAVTFPTTRLGIMVELAIGADRTADSSTWVWTDITNYWRPNSLITKTVGRPDQTSTVDPGTCSLVLDNSDGRFVRTNPNGPWFGQLNKNTPLRVRINWGDGWTTWFWGEIPDLAPKWDISGKDKWVTVQAAGAFRRLAQWRKPLRSALYRFNTGPNSDDHNGPPAGYWSLEDSEGATQAAPDVVGATPLRPFGYPRLSTSTGKLLPAAGYPKFGAGVASPGSDKVISLTDGGVLQGYCRPTTLGSNGWNFSWVMRFNPKPDGYAGFNGDILQFITENTITSTDLISFRVNVTATAVTVNMQSTVDAAGSGVAPVGAAFNVFDGAPHHYRFRCRNNGGNVEGYLYIDDNYVGGAIYGGFIIAPMRQVIVNPNEMTGDLMPVALGHINVTPSFQFYVGDGGAVDAASGYDGETAMDRIERLCNEEGVAWTGATSYPSERMGPQPIAPFFEVLRDCEAADGGILAEFRTGVNYYPRTWRYNRAVDMSIGAGQLAAAPEPTDDDSDTRNDVTYRRPDGPPQQATDEDSIIRSDLYSVERTINTQDDDQALRLAQWELFLGTRESLRWPQVTIDLAATPSLVWPWFQASPGNARIEIADPPIEVGPGPIDLFVEGWTETIGWYDWRIELNCSDGSVYQVGILEDPVLGKADTAGSEVAAPGYNASATSILVATTSGPLWTTSAGQFPFDVKASTGEVMTVTNITGAVSPQTFTVTRGVNGVSKTLPTGSDIRLANPMVVAP